MENKNEKELTIKIEGKEWEKLIDDAFKKANKKAKIAGFRPGKAPKDMFIKNYGMESLYYEASNKAVEVAYDKMFEENSDLDIVTQPVVDITNIGEDGVEFKFTLTLKPEVTLGKYKGLKVKKAKVEVTKEEIEESINHMRERYKENIVKDGAIENGDVAVIDFDGYNDGVAFDGGKGENYSLEIGSNTFIPGFEEQLIGLKAGEEKEVNVTFPEDYHSEDLKGQPVVFKVKINEVKGIHIPELDENFFNDLDMEGIDTKEALEKQVKENIEVQKEKQVEDEWLNSLLEEAASTMTVDIPEVMIAEETKRMIGEYSQNLQMQGITIEQFYQFTGLSEEKLYEEYKEQATKRVTFRLMIEAIIKEENIEVTEEELDKEVVTVAEKYKMTKEEFFKNFGEEMIRFDLKVRKVFDLIKGDK
jgi:trigger factor